MKVPHLRAIGSLLLVLLTSLLVSADQTPRVGNIDPDDKAKFSTRYESKNSRTFFFGPAVGSNLNTTDMLYYLGGGYDWEVGSQGAVTAQLNSTFGGGAAFLSALIGGKYFLSDTDLSPMIRAGFGFGVADGKNLDARGGFAGSLGAGLKFFRTSTVHLEIAVDHTFLFAQNQEGTPGVSSVTLAIFF